ncbi:MAG: shikimate kinase [Alphaproteobacteria bacterium]|nr:shikimate kinase [Alphaproteobacteria bacterium]
MTATSSAASNALNLTKPVVLVGLMGAGKSTIGRRLATVLGLSFIDSDQEIVEAAGCSISDIFEMYGEDIFRDLEKRVLARLISSEPCVIATGGGAFIQNDIREAIAQKAISVWLRADLDVLVERVSRRDTRPLLRTGDKGDILAKLMEDRYPIYATADITIDSNAGSHESVVDDIMESLKNISHA